MYTRRNIRWRIIFRFAWRSVIWFIAWSVFVTFAYLQCRQYGFDISLPLAPLSTIGVAVAFYIGFKNNQSYDRNWEARKIWGGIVNVSRSFANQTLAYVSVNHSGATVDEANVRQHKTTLIYRHLAWMHALRFQLRRKTSFGFEPKGSARRYMQPTDIGAMKAQLSELLSDDELRLACDKINSATQILCVQAERIRELTEEDHLLEEFRMISMMNLLTEMYTLQGKCERIKNTPFPRQYAYFSAVFTWIFITLIPLGLLSELGDRQHFMVWMNVPLSVVISWIFLTMEMVGDASEDPFENFVNDVPMTSMCRSIEIDLRQMLGEKEVPSPIAPINDILM